MRNVLNFVYYTFFFLLCFKIKHFVNLIFWQLFSVCKCIWIWLVCSIEDCIFLPAFYTGFSYIYLIAKEDWEWAIRRERELVVSEERERRVRWEGEIEGIATCTRPSHSLPAPARALLLTPSLPIALYAKIKIRKACVGGRARKASQSITFISRIATVYSLRKDKYWNKVKSFLTFVDLSHKWRLCEVFFCLVTLKKWGLEIRSSYHFQGSRLIEIIQDA